MTDDPRQLDPIEQMLVELGEARQAGVFERTQVDARQAVRQVQPRPLVMQVLAVAAVLALCVGVWTTMFRAEVADPQEGLTLASASLNPFPGEVAAQFGNCMTGPADSVVPGDCQDYDRDADGTVSLRDFSQALASAHP